MNKDEPELSSTSSSSSRTRWSSSSTPAVSHKPWSTSFFNLSIKINLEKIYFSIFYFSNGAKWRGLIFCGGEGGCIGSKSDFAQYEHFVKILGWSELCIRSSHFRFFGKTLIFDREHWPPIPNFLVNLVRWPQLEALCKISAFYINF